MAESDVRAAVEPRTETTSNLPLSDRLGDGRRVAVRGRRATSGAGRITPVAPKSAVASRTVGQHAAMDPDPAMRREPVQKRSKVRMERVLDAAEEIFVEKGYDGATTNQIAARAGTSIGSIYEFFSNKQALAQKLAERYESELTALYDEVVVDDPRGRDAIVDKVVDALADFYARHPGMGPLLRSSRGSEDLDKTGQKLQASLTDHIERLIAIRRATEDSDHRHIVAEMCAAVVRSVLDEVAGRPDNERKQLVDELKVVLIAYLRSALPRE